MIPEEKPKNRGTVRSTVVLEDRITLILAQYILLKMLDCELLALSYAPEYDILPLKMIFCLYFRLDTLGIHLKNRTEIFSHYCR